MSAYTLSSESLLSANDLFKLRYNLYLRWAALTAVMAILLIFLLMPRYTPMPYTERSTVVRLLEIPETIDLPEKVKAEPVVPPTIKPVDDSDAAAEDPEFASLVPIDTPFTNIDPIYTFDDRPDFRVLYEKPKLIAFVRPDYPALARMSRLEGTVLLKVRVGRDGLVKEVQIVQGVHPTLNKAAIEAAYRCRFSPGTQREQPVPVWMGLPFRFRLD